MEEREKIFYDENGIARKMKLNYKGKMETWVCINPKCKGKIRIKDDKTISKRHSLFCYKKKVLVFKSPSKSDIDYIKQNFLFDLPKIKEYVPQEKKLEKKLNLKTEDFYGMKFLK
jgi:hypothetical protein